MLFNELEFYTNVDKMGAAVADAKELFGENAPYMIEQRLGERIVIFNDHFIMTVREALTNGCMAKMNSEEELLFQQFIVYQNGSTYRDITEDVDEVVEALDQWLMDDMHCIPHPVINSCYDSTHTWSECTV